LDVRGLSKHLANTLSNTRHMRIMGQLH
jgi:hypothetical protein